MARLHLIRHAAFEGVGRTLAGRTDIPLSAEGREQARQLAADLATEPIAAVYTSPIVRARETADIIANACSVSAVDADAFAELDFGSWTGSDIHQLDSDAAWRDFNTVRSLTRVPGGELMLEAQTRAVVGLLAIQRRHGSETVAVVSHAGVIRAVLGHLLGIPMDNLIRLEIAPASVSTVELHGVWPQVHCIGRTASGYAAASSDESRTRNMERNV